MVVLACIRFCDKILLHMGNIGDHYRGLHEKIDGYLFRHEDDLTQEVVPTRLGLIVNENARANDELMVGCLKVPESITPYPTLLTVNMVRRR